MDNPYKSNKIRQKIKNKCFKDFGVYYYSQTKKAKLKQKLKWKNKSKEEKALVRIKVIKGMKRNGTYKGPSKPEKLTLKTLQNIYGKCNVKSEYIDIKRYPYHCDFYIPKFDLFIELNLFVTHMGKWFKNSLKDRQILNEWKLKYYNSKDSFIKAIIKNWTIKDVEKRLLAKKNKLNYKVIWNNEELDKWLNTLKKNPKILSSIKYSDYK